MTQDERRIRELVERWMAASRAGDIVTLLDLMTDDVVFMTPGRAPFGKETFASDAESMKGVSIEGRSDIHEINVIGDYAYIRNHIWIEIGRADSAPKRMSGFAMSIFRKGPDAKWRIARDANLVTPE
jgi:uncharacterized protein (TIGR02246 family)